MGLINNHCDGRMSTVPGNKYSCKEKEDTCVSVVLGAFAILSPSSSLEASITPSAFLLLAGTFCEVHFLVLPPFRGKLRGLRICDISG